MSALTTPVPWDELSRHYIEMEKAGHAFPLPPRFLPDEGSRVLDMGCGVGTHMRHFLARTPRVFGIDISANMIAEAVKVAPVARADSRAMPFGDAAFDYLWSKVVISCVPDWEAAFEEALRVAAPGGMLIFFVANRWSSMAPFRWALSRLKIYSEGYIRHLAKADFARHKGSYPFRVREHFAVQKEARSDNPLFLIAARILYGADRLLARIFRQWGGDLCVIVERLQVLPR